MRAVAELAPNCGVITAACAALDLSRASFHRRQAAATRPPVPVRPRPKPARALEIPVTNADLEQIRRRLDVLELEVEALRLWRETMEKGVKRLIEGVPE